MYNNSTGLIGQVLQSVINFKSYVAAKERPMGRAFLYLLIIMLIFGSLDSIRYCFSANEGIDEMHEAFKREMPDFKVAGNEFIFYGKMPYMQVSDSDNSIFVIDTTGQTDRSILDRYNKGVFINRTKIINKENAIETKEYSIGNIYQVFGEITKESLESLFSYTWVLFIFIFVGYFIYFYAAKLFGALIVSLIGLLIAGFMNLKERYGNIYKMSIYALTLPVALTTAVGFLEIDIPYQWFIYISIGFIYIGFALKAVKEAGTRNQ